MGRMGWPLSKRRNADAEQPAVKSAKPKVSQIVIRDEGGMDVPRSRS